MDMTEYILLVCCVCIWMLAMVAVTKSRLLIVGVPLLIALGIIIARWLL